MPSARQLLAQGSDRLKSSPHPERACADADQLLMHVLRRDRAGLIAHSEDELESGAVADYLELIERRHLGEPIQYIVGECEFYGLPFYVTPDVLIPRPETEHLVEAAIELVTRHNLWRIVDVGTGSGAIAIAIARALPECSITATDISEAALDVARRNAERNNVKVRFLNGDLLTSDEAMPASLIVSNPPYVADSDRESLSKEVREYEPALALYAGKDGLEIYRRLIPQVSRMISRGGHLLLEIGYGQANAVRALLQQAGFIPLRFVPDLQGIPRVIDATKPGRT